MKNCSRTATGFENSTPLLSDPQALRVRADADGFLFFKGLLPKEPLLELRRQILEIIDRRGWLKKGTPLMDAIGDVEAIAKSDALEPKWRHYGVSPDTYRAVQCLELFHSIPHHPNLISMYSTVFGKKVFPHPRHIARVLLPAPSLSPTPPHQDYIYIQGTHHFWTCWFPLGDCPMDLGGLSVLRGSHKENVLNVSSAKGAGGFESILCELDYEWAQDNYECGDVLTFPSHMVHKALPNQHPGHIRLSCDMRYQPADEPIHQDSLIPHMHVATWDELYQGWKSQEHQYYWKSNKFQFIEWNPALLQGKERYC